VVPEVLEDRAGENDAEPAADAEDPRYERDRTGDPLARKLVPENAEREREDRTAEALDRPGDDQECQRADERRQKTAGREAEEGHDEHALLSEHVAQPACDRRHDRRGERIGREEPGHPRRRGMQVTLVDGQRGHDERL
jgi:hypothetical protein